jgi:hypothetical protein
VVDGKITDRGAGFVGRLELAAKRRPSGAGASESCGDSALTSGGRSCALPLSGSGDGRTGTATHSRPCRGLKDAGSDVWSATASAAHRASFGTHIATCRCAQSSGARSTAGRSQHEAVLPWRVQSSANLQRRFYVNHYVELYIEWVNGLRTPRCGVQT